MEELIERVVTNVLTLKTGSFVLSASLTFLSLQLLFKNWSVFNTVRLPLSNGQTEKQEAFRSPEERIRTRYQGITGHGTKLFPRSRRTLSLRYQNRLKGG